MILNTWVEWKITIKPSWLTLQQWEVLPSSASSTQKRVGLVSFTLFSARFAQYWGNAGKVRLLWNQDQQAQQKLTEQGRDPTEKVVIISYNKWQTAHLFPILFRANYFPAQHHVRGSWSSPRDRKARMEKQRSSWSARTCSWYLSSVCWLFRPLFISFESLCLIESL